MSKDLRGFSGMDGDKLKSLLKVLEKEGDRGYLTQEQITERMSKDLLGFSGMDGDKLQSLLKVLQEDGDQGYFTKNQISDMMRSNLASFSDANSQNFSKLLEYFKEDLQFSKKEIQELLTSSLYVFSRTDRGEIESMVQLKLSNGESLKKIKIDLQEKLYSQVTSHRDSCNSSANHILTHFHQ
jgi:hypothetical protein